MTKTLKQPKLANHTIGKKLLVDAASKGMTDKEISDYLFQKLGIRWHEETVRRVRTKMGVHKGSESIVNQGVIGHEMGGLSLSAPPPTLEGLAKAEWYRDQFKQTHLYSTLVTQFDSDEVTVYIEEYGHVCCQFEDIVISEFFQIDDFLKHRLLINRQLHRMKEIDQQIAQVQEWIDENPLKPEAAKEDRQERMERFRHLDGLITAQNKANERYDKLTAERQRIYQSLAATRKDRIDDLKGGGDSFFTLVGMIQASETARTQHGRYAELARLAAQDINTEFRKSVTFPDGTKAPIILDAETPTDTESPVLDEVPEEGAPE